MAADKGEKLLLFAATAAVLLSAAPVSALPQLDTYVVHAPAHGMPQVFSSCKLWHTQLVESVSGGNGVSAVPHGRILYYYSTVLEGFAVQLTAAEAASLRATDGVLMAVKDTLLQLHTTRSPSFLGLSLDSAVAPSSSGNGSTLHVGVKPTLWGVGRKGEDVVIGVLDTGVWPEHRSFSDEGYSAALPRRWTGECESSPTFNASSACNRKLIGARAFFRGYESGVGAINGSTDFRSPRDSNGHGTHTASTAAGSVAVNASLFGLASGTASGTAPSARLAVYKTCWSQGCTGADVLAGFEAAILDGVDIISASLGGDSGGSVEYYQDPIAIGSFAAATRGIITSCSAGNSGPSLNSVINVAPWLLTVAASTLDRDFPAPVVLGNGTTVPGASLYGGKGLGARQIPLVYAGDTQTIGVFNASFCVDSQLLDRRKVEGKMLLCDRGINGRAAKGFVAKELGAAGLIVGNTELNGEELLAESYVLPAALVGFSGYAAMREYIRNSEGSATATILFEGTRLHVKPAPAMAGFSSRGPNTVTREILKPDLTAPGVNILAAWTGHVGPTGDAQDERRTEFNIISGTSMSCPHVSGLAALLKAAHPEWSPAAIKSALMTSAAVTDNRGEPLLDVATGRQSFPITHGAGHAHPNAALSPGLIYDMTNEDYAAFICAMNYTAAVSNVFTTSCNATGGAPGVAGGIKARGPGELNYPSFSVVYFQDAAAVAGGSFKATFSRVVTNVGPATSTYHVTIAQPEKVNVTVDPTALSFSARNEKLSYSVTFSAGRLSLAPEFAEGYAFGSLAWSDGYHTVRSPISFTWVL